MMSRMSIRQRPSGLKPTSFVALNGAAEAVPFQQTVYSTVHAVPKPFFPEIFYEILVSE